MISIPEFKPLGTNFISSYKNLYLSIFALFLAHFVVGQTIDVANLKKHIVYLSSDKLAGRLVGTTGEKKSAQYIKKHFKALSIKPLNDKKYIKEFSFKYNSNPHDTSGKDVQELTGRNVVAYLDNNSNKTIVIGAHYDHIGKNQLNLSTLPNATEIHNGADDNVSGVAGVLELAKVLSQNNIKEQTNFIFACFSAEEEGLLGSKVLANEIIQHPSKIVAMINMDMIGRMDSLNNLYVGGVGTAKIFNSILNKHKPNNITLTIDSSGIGPSDHTSFYLKNIPVLFFFTGTHLDYHKPTDDESKINYPDLNLILTYISSIINEISHQEKLEFIKTKNKAQNKRPTYKVTLGIMPNYADYGDGLHIDAVIDNKPANLGGIITGISL